VVFYGLRWRLKCHPVSTNSHCRLSHHFGRWLFGKLGESAVRLFVSFLFLLINTGFDYGATVDWGLPASPVLPQEDEDDSGNTDKSR